MNVLSNVWTVITAIGVVYGLISSILTVKEHVKKIKGNNMKKIFEHPLKSNLFWSLIGTILCAILFYIFGGFDTDRREKKYLLDNKQQIKTQSPQINPTVKILDTSKPTPKTNTKTHRVIKKTANPNNIAPLVEAKKDSIKPNSTPQISITAPNYGNQQNGNYNTMNIKSEEKKLSEVELTQIFNDAYNVSIPKGRGIVIAKMDYCNAPAIYKQLIDYFNKHNIEPATATLSVSSNVPTVDGVKIDISGKAGIKVLVGYFK